MAEQEWITSVQWVGIVAACLIQKDNKYLMVQEKQKKVYGLWNLPAGHVDKNEDIRSAAIREAKEESGYEVELIEEIAIFHESNSTPVKHIFTARIVGGSLAKQEDEILDIKWFTYDEIKSLEENNKLRAPWLWEVISRQNRES